MTSVILDTDFLSSFLKIQKPNLIKDFFGVDELIIPTAVFREISMTKLISNLIKIRWIKVVGINEEDWEIELIDKCEFIELGEGEKESILCCKNLSDSILLINDKKARAIAMKNNINVLNIPAFLFACKNTGFLDNKEISDIINDLKEKDYYEFKEDERKYLLA